MFTNLAIVWGPHIERRVLCQLVCQLTIPVGDALRCQRKSKILKNWMARLHSSYVFYSDVLMITPKKSEENKIGNALLQTN